MQIVWAHPSSLRCGTAPVELWRPQLAQCVPFSFSCSVKSPDPELWYDCGCMNIGQLLTYINARHATAFELAGKLPGGNQDGAYVLAEPSGRRAVLKQLFAPRALPIMRRLHAIGYPTPDVLYSGTADDGTTYLVQEFVPGAPMATLTDAYLDQLFTLNDLQANLNPTPRSECAGELVGLCV